MSNLLSQASLVMIPSGYKEDVVYSAIPSNGNGDLSFTRASNGTRVNSAGLVEVVPWNLLEYSNAFNTAPWSMNVTSGQAGKDGQNNAWLLTKVTATTSDVYNSNVYNGDQTFTIYVKKESGKGFKLYPIGTTTTSVEVNLQTGAVLNQGGAITSTTVEAYSSTWWKISVALNMINSNYYIYVTDGAGTQIASSITIQDAQVNIGLTAKTYFPTTDRLNVPRLTYQNGGGGCPSLLLEKQSTNYIPYSEDYTNAAWTKNGISITANDTTSPDGTQNADKLTSNDPSGSVYRIYETATTPSDSVCSVSCYFKYDNWQYAFIVADNYSGVGRYAVFDLINATNTYVSSGYTATISSVGNGWYKCTITGEFGINAYCQFGLALTSTTYNGASIANGKNLYVWGTQREISSYPTSYIPTTSASATRVADVCRKTGIGALVGGTSGTVFFDIKTNPVLSSASYKQFCYYFDSASAQSYMYLGGTNLITTNSNWGSLSGATALVANTRYKIALVYAPNDFALYVNGVSVATASSGTPKDNVNISIGQFNGGEMCEFVFNQYTHFPSRLTNAELIALTTI